MNFGQICTLYNHFRATQLYIIYLFQCQFKEIGTPNSSRNTIKWARGALLPPLPVNMAALQDIPDVLAQTIEDQPERFLLRDNQVEGRRLIVFASNECLVQLGRSTSWFVQLI